MRTKFDLQRFADEEVAIVDTAESSSETATVEAAEESTVTTGTVTITVQDSSGAALEGATISYTVNAIACDGTTDENGQLTVEELPAGIYTFTAVMDGYTSNTVDVTVTAGETVIGTIALTKEETSVTEEIKDAAETAITTSLASSASSNNGIITWATEEIARLSKEMGTTSDFYVKYVRNPIEIAALGGALAVATAGIKKVITELADK
jgi:hypothetical protein